jgi:hypothetical protein
MDSPSSADLSVTARGGGAKAKFCFVLQSGLLTVASTLIYKAVVQATKET